MLWAPPDLVDSLEEQRALDPIPTDRAVEQRTQHVRNFGARGVGGDPRDMAASMSAGSPPA